MSKRKKRRRRPPQPAHPAASPVQSGARRGSAPGRGGDGRAERGERREDDRTRTVALIQPRLLPSLARGLLAVGRSPSVLVTGFLGLLVLWLLFSTTGVIRAIAPGSLGQLLSVPPLHSALLDGNLLNVAVRVFPPPATLALMASIVVVRAALTSYWLAVIHAKLAGEAAEGQRPTSRARPAFRAILGLEALFLAVLVGLPIVLAQFLGVIGLLGAVIGATYFLVYAPAVAMVEGVGVRESIRLAARAARARGPQHTVLVFTYIMGVLLVVTWAFAGRAAPATPSVLVWSYALVATFLHLGVLATFVDRWLSLRQDVLAWMTARGRPGRALAGSVRR